MHLRTIQQINQLESYFVVRAMRNLQYRCVNWRKRLPESVLTDAEIKLSKESLYKKYHDKLRLVRYHDSEQKRDFTFLTNAIQ